MTALPVVPEWEPVLGASARASRRRVDRDAIERRAAELGLQPLRWPRELAARHARGDAGRDVRQADRPRGRVLAGGVPPGVRRRAGPRRQRHGADRRGRLRDAPDRGAEGDRAALGRDGARARAARGPHGGSRARCRRSRSASAVLRDRTCSSGRSRPERSAMKANRAFELIVSRGGLEPAFLADPRPARPDRGRVDRRRRGRRCSGTCRPRRRRGCSGSCAPTSSGSTRTSSSRAGRALTRRGSCVRVSATGREGRDADRGAEPARADARAPRGRVAGDRADLELAVEVDMAATPAARAGDARTRSRRLVVRACALGAARGPAGQRRVPRRRFELYSRVNVGRRGRDRRTRRDPDRVRRRPQDARRSSSREIARLEDRRAAGKLSPPELAAATFTVWNAGGARDREREPVIVPPQAAALQLRRDPGDAGRPRRSRSSPGQSMTLTLACDHRILYGEPAAALPGGDPAPAARRGPRSGAARATL